MNKSCSIRTMEERDVLDVLSWRNHPDIRKCMITQHEISLDEHLDWFGRASTDATKRLLIVEDEQKIFGYVYFNGASLGGVADWGFYTAPNSAKGSGRKLGFAALDFAFFELGVHKICGQVLACNEASLGFHRMLGFQQEGILRDQYKIDENYYAAICFGLLQHEWLNQEKKAK